MEKRILLVEDDANFRRVFTRALRLALAPEQIDVTFVESGLWPRHVRGCGRVGWTPR